MSSNLTMAGKEVRAIRKRLGLTQAELAELVGVSRVSVANWESEVHGVRESAARLMRVLVKQRAQKHKGRE
jgi:DNA-binding transcriptional regulator YiaG